MENPDRFYYGLANALRANGMTCFAADRSLIYAGLEAAVVVAEKEGLKDGRYFCTDKFVDLIQDFRIAFCESPDFDRIVFKYNAKAAELVLDQFVEDEKLPLSAIEGYKRAAVEFHRAFDEEWRQQQSQRILVAQGDIP